MFILISLLVTRNYTCTVATDLFCVGRLSPQNDLTSLCLQPSFHDCILSSVIVRYRYRIDSGIFFTFVSPIVVFYCQAVYIIRVATNLENLECSGISLNVENSGNSQGILCNLKGKL